MNENAVMIDDQIVVRRKQVVSIWADVFVDHEGTALLEVVPKVMGLMDCGETICLWVGDDVWSGGRLTPEGLAEPARRGKEAAKAKLPEIAELIWPDDQGFWS